MLRTAQLLPLYRAFDTGLRPDPFPDRAASLLPGLLAATRTGLPPASDDELTTTDQPPTRSTSCLLGARENLTGNGIERLPRSVSRERLPSAEAPSDGVGPVLPCGAGRRGLASGDVFVRASIRRNSAGVPVRYLQLVHNVWDPVSPTSKAKVLALF